MSKFLQATLHYCFILLACHFLLLGCVPSPTATPPRQTPFPTLPLVDGTQTPQGETTDTAATPPLISSTQVPTSLPPLTNAPRSTQIGFLADTFPPIVQLTVQDPELPVSSEQAVPLNVLAADNMAVTRLELYDNNVLYGQTNVTLPAAVYSNQFIWKSNVLGKHTLRALAYDAQGNASRVAQIELDLINNNRAPAIQITSPSGSKDAEIGAPILIQGVATDDVAVTRMELLVDNQLVTFVVPERAGGVTPFAVAIPWTPMTTGSHNIVLRAYDNQNQSDDSLRYTIRVFDNQPPVVTAQSEHTTIATGDVFVVDALALSNNGIGRVELYVDDRLTDGTNSNSPSQQTALQTILTASDLENGTHSFFVRAYDVTGQTADTPRENFQVEQGAPRVSRETRVAQSTRTPLPPTPTATPQINLPGPPTIELQLTNAPVALPNAARIQITARGSAELDRIELWARLPGETSAQLVTEENVKGATEKTIMFDWLAPRAGVVEMYARVSDNLKQARLSVPLRFSVDAPRAPTPPPAVFDFARTWLAESPAAQFQVTFRQIGRALRGTLMEQRADGTSLQGEIVSGAVNEKNVLFAVDFQIANNASSHTLEFDCAFNARPPVLTCNYTNENGERGSAVFQPLEQ